MISCSIQKESVTHPFYPSFKTRLKTMKSK